MRQTRSPLLWLGQKGERDDRLISKAINTVITDWEVHCEINHATTKMSETNHVLTCGEGLFTWSSGRGIFKEPGPKGWKKPSKQRFRRTGGRGWKEPCEFKVLEEAGGGRREGVFSGPHLSLTSGSLQQHVLLEFGKMTNRFDHTQQNKTVCKAI